MASHDVYVPSPDIPCAWCQSQVPEWRGSRGPCSLFVWAQGHRHPIDQQVEDRLKLDPRRRIEFTLPETFWVWGRCPNGHVMILDCRCTDGVWTGVDASASRMEAVSGSPHRAIASSEADEDLLALVRKLTGDPEARYLDVTTPAFAYIGDPRARPQRLRVEKILRTSYFVLVKEADRPGWTMGQLDDEGIAWCWGVYGSIEQTIAAL